MPGLDVTFGIKRIQRNALLGPLPLILKNVHNTSKFKAFKVRLDSLLVWMLVEMCP